MKKTLKIIGLFILFFSLFYLLGAFVSISFDLNKWSVFCREVIGLIGGFMAILIAMLITNEL